MSKRISFVLLAISILFLAGCPQPLDDEIIPVETGCPGKASIRQAVKIIRLQKQNVMPFRAKADCVFSYRKADGTDKDEPVGGDIVFVPKGNIFFKGSKFGEIRFGANAEEFWLRVKPELDTYWYGSKVIASECNEKLLINPANVAEALGVVDVTTDWTLSHRDGYDLLDLIEDGKKKKRVYVNTCDYRIELIEYFDADEFKRIGIELGNYTTNDDGIMVPSVIRFSYYDDMGLEESAVRIELKHVRYLPPEKQKKKLFVRPGRDGYKKLLHLNADCEFELVEE